MMESVMDASSPRCYDSSNHIAAATGIAYDAAGDMIRDGKHRYEYDAERRISQVDGGAAEYLYSAEGDRIEKRVGDASTETIWVGDDPIAELKPDGTWVDYLYAFEQPHTFFGFWSVLKLRHECKRSGYRDSSS